MKKFLIALTILLIGTVANARVPTTNYIWGSVTTDTVYAVSVNQMYQNRERSLVSGDSNIKINQLDTNTIIFNSIVTVPVYLVSMNMLVHVPYEYNENTLYSISLNSTNECVTISQIPIASQGAATVVTATYGLSTAWVPNILLGNADYYISVPNTGNQRVVYLTFHSNNQMSNKITAREFSTASVALSYLTSTLAHWKLADATGANGTDSRGTYTLTLQGGAATQNSSGPFGYNRGTFSSTKYFTVTDNANFDITTCAIEFWFQIPTSDQQYHYVYSKRSGPYGKYVYILNDGSVQCYMDGFYLVSPTGYMNNNWHYVFIGNRQSSGTNERRMYVDGALVAQGTGLNCTDITSGSTIGIDNDTGIPVANTAFIGNICQLAFHSDISGYSWDTLGAYITSRYNSGLGNDLQ